MGIKTIGLGVFALLASLAFLVADGGKAFAHYVYNSGFTYYSSEDCVYVRSETSHGSGNGYSRSDVESKFRGAAGGTYCNDYLYRPAGYIKIRQIFQLQLTPGWSFCRDTGWIYNSGNVATMTVARTHSSKCGTGNYRTDSNAQMLNGSWKGGSLISPVHWL